VFERGVIVNEDGTKKQHGRKYIMSTTRPTTAIQHILYSFKRIHHAPISDFMREYLETGCERAFMDLSVRCERLTLTPSEFREAARVISEIENKTEPHTLREDVLLGYAYELGVGLKQDHRKAKLYYEEAGAKLSPNRSAQDKRDCGIALSNLASLYWNGHYVTRDTRKAYTIAKLAVETGSGHAIGNFHHYNSRYYSSTGQPEFFVTQQAFCIPALQNAAKSGHGDAHTDMMSGITTLTWEQKQHHLQESARHGNAYSLQKLESLCKDGETHFQLKYHVAVANASNPQNHPTSKAQAKKELNDLAKKNPRLFYQESLCVNRERIFPLLDDKSVLQEPVRTSTSGVFAPPAKKEVDPTTFTGDCLCTKMIFNVIFNKRKQLMIIS
jgi:hypothetical protein